MTVTVQKWGNSLGVRLPRAVTQSAKLGVGSQVEVKAQRGRIILEPVAVPTLAELLAQVKPRSRPEVVDWGRPVGKEAW
jgi:antitoxin MazE